jgi:xanthine dehydrogenase accessory factor
MALACFERTLVVVRGGGDLASGVVYRLARAGFPVVVLELDTPLFVRRAVSYGDAVYSGAITVDGVTARLARDVESARSLTSRGDVAVLVDPVGESLPALQPAVVVDARMEKANLGTTLDDAPVVITLGPGFTAGVDCHAVIETNRGHDLGRVITRGSAEPDTGEPGSVQNQTHSRVLRAPAEGHVVPMAAIGDMLEAGQSVAQVGGAAIVAPFRGVLRGLIHERVWARVGMKIGDLDPRAQRENCFTISDKSLSVGGGVLEAVLAAPQLRALWRASHETERGV